MEIAEKVCDKLAIINKGQMLFCGSLPELQAQRGTNDSLERLFLMMTERSTSTVVPS